jgi:hypothetical protein
MGRPRTPTAVLALRGASPKYLVMATAAMWLEMGLRGYWLASAGRFLVENSGHVDGTLSDRRTQVGAMCRC